MDRLDAVLAARGPPGGGCEPPVGRAGKCECDPMSDPDDESRWQAEEVISRGYKHDPEFMKLIETTKRADDLEVDDYDVMVVAGGQGPMFTLERAENLQRKFVDFYESGKVTAALCHGVAILRFATLSAVSRWSTTRPSRALRTSRRISLIKPYGT